MRRLILWSALVLFCGGLVLIGVGTVRYGGPEGLVMRVEAEIQARVPHEEHMPTPLPTPTGVVPTEQLPSPSPSLSPSLSPSPMPMTPSPQPTAPATSTRAQPTASTTATQQPTAGPTDTPVPTDTLAPTDVVTPTAAGTPAYALAAPAVELAGFTHVWQIWNNCGPASLVMDLSHYGVNISQEKAGAAIRPNKEDKHAGPDELAAYARTLGFQALNRVDGTPEELKLFLSNNIPVILGTWHKNDKGEEMSHYRLLTGYDDAKQEWILYDSLESRGISADKPYVGIRISYAEMTTLWAVMNRSYVVVWKDDQTEIVEGIIGEDLDDAVMWRKSLAWAQEQVAQHPDDAYALFTLGTNLVAAGQWQAAAEAYDRARVIGLPFRMLWYQHGPLRAYYETGRFQELLALADATLEKTTEVEELHYWKGMGLWATGDTAGARAEFQTALAQRPAYADAAAALAKLGQ